MQNQEEPESQIDFRRLTISSVEKLVGKKAIDMKVVNKWVTLFFDGGLIALPNGMSSVAAGISVSFRRW